MDEKLLKKEEIGKLYEYLSRYYNFYAPVKINGQVNFKKISNPDEIELDFLNSRIPPKEVIFPRMETLFKYKMNGKDIEILEGNNEPEKNIIFGIRPCDAYSFHLLEMFFAWGKFQDELFLSKRKNTVLMGLGCNEPRQTCFCTSLDYQGHPHRSENMDIFLCDLGDNFLFKAVSKAGKAIMDKLTWLSNAGKNDLKKADDLLKRAESLMAPKLNIDDTADILDKCFDDPLWEDISANCLGCGTCAFLCPTCTCFDVVDEPDKYNNRGKRIRIWDTCQFCIYTLHTSGHNPRNSKIERCRNRILHKFSYYPKNYGLIGCVGCGRCVQSCPVNNDIRQIIKKINRINKQNKEEEILVS
ncbi:MAG: 4Fe-4S dicluster domain-containing protein [Candidatus Lokiarchaeota archaeon]|nr:4Fe-4S dicluster domain-containing protein [Candidatus Lokiarchaeota archaeon]